MAFTEQTQPVRYIHEEHRKGGSRVDSAAFIPNPGESYLSVNSLDIERMAAIARYYKALFGDSGSRVALTTHRLASVNVNAKAAGLTLIYNRTAVRWEFADKNQQSPAYKARPVPVIHGRPPSDSHCGIEYMRGAQHFRVLTDLGERKLARRLASAKFHWVQA